MGMTGVFNRLITRIFPPVPKEIRDDVAILRADRIETLTPMLFLMLAGLFIQLYAKFVLRRSFGGNPTYSAVFTRYLGAILARVAGLDPDGGRPPCFG